jgi:hypothetical protein
VIVLATILILLIGGRIVLRKRAQSKRQEEAQENGRKLEGKIVAVKQQTGFDRERSRVDIRIKLNYYDPDAGSEKTIFYILDRHTKNLPDRLGFIGAGIVNTSSLVERHREMKEKRRQLELEGHSKDQIKKLLMEIALAEVSSGSTQQDSDGYLILNEPVVVDVYLNHERANPENGIYVVFRS